MDDFRLSLNLSVTQFSYLQNGDENDSAMTPHRAMVRIELVFGNYFHVAKST